MEEQWFTNLIRLPRVRLCNLRKLERLNVELCVVLTPCRRRTEMIVTFLVEDRIVHSTRFCKTNGVHLGQPKLYWQGLATELEGDHTLPRHASRQKRVREPGVRQYLFMTILNALWFSFLLMASEPFRPRLPLDPFTVIDHDIPWSIPQNIPLSHPQTILILGGSSFLSFFLFLSPDYIV